MNTEVCQTMDPVRFTAYLHMNYGNVARDQANYELQIEYKVYRRGQHRIKQKYRFFTKRMLVKYYRDQEIMLEYADGFPRDRLVSEIKVKPLKGDSK